MIRLNLNKRNDASYFVTMSAAGEMLRVEVVSGVGSQQYIQRLRTYFQGYYPSASFG